MGKRTTFRLRALALAFLAGCLASCAGAKRSDTGWTTSVDTLPNGALHVVNTPPSDGGTPQWTLEEELRIGSETADSPDLFGRLAGLEVLADGRIAVLEAQTQQVRIFGPDGTHLATFGGEGEGPGEFKHPLGMMRDAQDRLWVADVSNARMSIMDATAGFQRSFPLHLMRFGFMWNGVIMNDGRMIKWSLTLGPPRRDVYRVRNDSMRTVDSIPVPPAVPYGGGGQSTFAFRSDHGGSYYSIPFRADDQRIFDPRGGTWSSVGGDPTYRVIRWTPDRDTTLVMETRRRPVPVTTAEKDSAIAFIKDRTKAYGDVEQDWSLIPSVRPGVKRLFLAENGELWVQTPVEGGGILYDRYDDSGQYLGSITSDLHVYEWVFPVVRGDTFWAVVTDEFDVPYVVRAKIVATGSAGGSS